jgi:tRNA threonylcarbamoyladenosine biosynthesis protein TsaB
VDAFSDSALTLVIDASTARGTVALFAGSRVLGAHRVAMGAGKEDQLFPALQQLLARSGKHPRDLGAIVCGEGPGGFTSLRIAAALAKGLAHGAGCPLYAVPSLLLAAASLSDVPFGEYVVHAEALRGERYVLPVRRDDGGFWRPAGAAGRMAAEKLQSAVPPGQRLAVLSSPFDEDLALCMPAAECLASARGEWRDRPLELTGWEPLYGRLAEAQVKWEERYGISLPKAPVVRS